MNQRPSGVTILALLAAVSGLAAIWLAVDLFVGAEETTALILPKLTGLVRLLGLIALVCGVLELVFAYGAWSLKAWAWKLGVGLEIAVAIVAVLRLGHGVPGSHLLALILAVITLWYLFRPGVRAAFNS